MDLTAQLFTHTRIHTRARTRAHARTHAEFPFLARW